MHNKSNSWSLCITVFIGGSRRQTWKPTYRHYSVLVDYEYSKYAHADWLTVQTTQKYVYLTFQHSFQPENLSSRIDMHTLAARP